jgi:LysM repeat protein
MSPRLIVGYFVLAVFALSFLVVAIVVIRVITLDTPSEENREPTSASYVVQEGDSLAAISRDTNVPVDEIQRLNPRLDPLTLLPGTKLRLKPVTRRERRRAQLKRARIPRRYIVKPGDGLLGIAEKTDVPVERLRSLNKRKNLNKLVPGMRLRLRPRNAN